jgi:hypothetical protein
MRDRAVLKTGTYADVSAIAGSTQDTALSFAAVESAADTSASLQTPASPGLAHAPPPGGVDEARTSSGQVPATSGSVEEGSIIPEAAYRRITSGGDYVPRRS